MFGKIYTDVEEFYTTCYGFLEKYEAENNLIFGILETLRTNIQAYQMFDFFSFTLVFR